MATQEYFHDVSAGAIKDQKMPPSEALQKILENAQASHRVCLRSAKKDGVDPIEKCALTWHEVWQRYRQWSAYRAPFADQESQSKYNKKWTKAKKEAFDHKL